MNDAVLTNILADVAALKAKYAARGIAVYLISAEYIFLHVPPPKALSTSGTGATSE